MKTRNFYLVVMIVFFVNAIVASQTITTWGSWTATTDSGITVGSDRRNLPISATVPVSGVYTLNLSRKIELVPGGDSLGIIIYNQEPIFLEVAGGGLGVWDGPEIELYQGLEAVTRQPHLIKVGWRKQTKNLNIRLVIPCQPGKAGWSAVVFINGIVIKKYDSKAWQYVDDFDMPKGALSNSKLDLIPKTWEFYQVWNDSLTGGIPWFGNTATKVDYAFGRGGSLVPSVKLLFISFFNLRAEGVVTFSEMGSHYECSVVWPMSRFFWEYTFDLQVYEEVAPTVVATTHGQPENFVLEQNYPNPFNPQTTISYDLPLQEHVALTIYDVTGAVVTSLVDGEQAAGSYSLVWNADGEPSGIYFCELRTASFRETRRMQLVK